MPDEQHVDVTLAAKDRLKPVSKRQSGTFECPLCGERQNVDGNCPSDGIPLRRLPESEH